MRVVFMGTPNFALPALQALIDSGHEIVAVYTQPPRPAGRGLKLTPSPVQMLAEKNNITVEFPKSLRTAEAQAVFASYKPDVAVVTAYGLILPQPILDAPRFGCINIHPSDLPRWRGAAPLHRTILAGDTVTACCIMRMDAGLDTGPVLARTVYPIAEGTTTGQLHDAMAALGATMTLSVLEALEAGGAVAAPQSETGATYAAKITREDRIIDWRQPAWDILQQVLALSPVPGAMAFLNGEWVKIFGAAVEPGDAAQKPGTALDDRLLVNTGDGHALRLMSLQRAGKSRQEANQLLQGFNLPAGTVVQNP
jgi:methionyl-tRNA formyltransferase